ncbi:MAG: hypothetical protein JXO72_07655 [Vicinamibacteria bacterium]|nr:hypothetical protein [Vicinamibacteria bacterium]
MAPLVLVRGRCHGGPGSDGKGHGVSCQYGVGQYVTDRPYAASSFLRVAIARVFTSALAGRCRGRQAPADTAWPII